MPLMTPIGLHRCLPPSPCMSLCHVHSAVYLSLWYLFLHSNTSLRELVILGFFPLFFSVICWRRFFFFCFSHLCSCHVPVPVHQWASALSTRSPWPQMSEQAAARQVHCAAGLCFASSHPSTSCSVMLTVVESTLSRHWQQQVKERWWEGSLLFREADSCSLQEFYFLCCSGLHFSPGLLGQVGAGGLLCIRYGLSCPPLWKTTTMGSHLYLVHIVVHVLLGVRGQKACALVSICSLCVCMHMFELHVYAFIYLSQVCTCPVRFKTLWIPCCTS